MLGRTRRDGKSEYNDKDVRRNQRLLKPEEIDSNAIDGLFGLLKRRVETMPRTLTFIEETRSAEVSFAVDCSVPLNGQFASIEFIASRYARLIYAAGLKASDFRLSKNPLILGGEPVLPAREYHTAFEPSDHLSNKAQVWRLISIDVIRHLDTHLKECRRLLLKERRKLVESGLVKESDHERLRTKIDGTHEGGVESLKDGHILKAYVIIAECQLAGITKSEDIIEILAEKGAGSQVYPAKKGYNWLHDREERAVLFDNYAEKAMAYVEQDYKWLIDTQNPPIGER